ncbi:MAG: hypothetical protein IJC09_01620 [Clostridia bacterium]|nr:hypothetical protein [Clostridia bacterium]
MGKFREKNALRCRLFPVIGAVIVFIVSFCVLYLGDNVGLSDNGDFRRVLLTNNIEYKDSDNHYYLFKENYRMKLVGKDSLGTALWSAWQTNNEEEIYKSPHFLIIKLSKVMNVIANAITNKPLTDYHIAYMAVLYIFMLSVAAWAIFAFFSEARLRTQIAVFVVFIFMFCDAGYLLYFNSFYGEPLQYTSLMLLIALGMLIYKRPTIPKVIGFYIALYFFAGSKLANIAYSLIVALLAILIMIMRKDKLFRIGVILSAVVCFINIVALYVEIPDWMDNDTTYQSVFLGITKNSDNPEKDLRELGVDEKYAVLAGTHAYMDEDEYPIDIKTRDFEKNFYEKVSKADIALFYIKHPVRLIKETVHAIENSAYIRPPVVGNSAKIPMQFTDKWSGWSKLRVILRFLYEPWFILLAFVIITLYMIFMNVIYIHNHKTETPERRYMIYALDILVLGLWINMLLPIICNGEADIAKHMFLFTNCIDILFAVGVVALVGASLKDSIKITVFAAVFTGLFHITIPKPTITFGELSGKPLKWERIKEYDDGTVLLVTKDCVGYMPFDDETNSWESSEVREWLNSEFLAEFSAAEREKIVKTKNKNFLAYADRDKAEGGNHAHYWNFTPRLVYDMGETAYHNYVEDEVFIPTLSVMDDIDVRTAYWVMCPYTSNTYMSRFMNSDGFILHTDVKSEKGVRAALRIKEE